MLTSSITVNIRADFWAPKSKPDVIHKKMPEFALANKWNYAITGTEHGGPFNVVSDTAPKDKRDRRFWKHDVGYSKLGNQAYYKYNLADANLLKSIAKSKHPGDYLPYYYFLLKKYLAPRMGNLRGQAKTMAARRSQRPRMRDTPSKLTRAELMQAGRPSSRSYRAKAYSSRSTAMTRYTSKAKQQRTYGQFRPTANRFHGYRTKQTIGSRPKRWKKLKAKDKFKPKDFIDYVSPLYKWNMCQILARPNTSLKGEQGAFNGDAMHYICTRSDL